RQLPHHLMKRAVAHWDRTYAAPFVMYFHTWELDPAQPKLNGVPFLSRVRQYRNLDKMAGILRHYLARYRFSSISEYLGLHSAPVTAAQPARPLVARDVIATKMDLDWQRPEAVGTQPASRRAVSVVIPCFNEELILPYLNNTLQSVERTLRPTYDLQFIFVDDGSSDGTWTALQQTFGPRDNCLTIRHTTNQGVAAAMMTGIRAAGADVVCSMDCDCTYDPHELSSMIPLLIDGVDMVTASPYHPLGSVKNVPQWRLTLSQGASALYRLVLH